MSETPPPYNNADRLIDFVESMKQETGKVLRSLSERDHYDLYWDSHHRSLPFGDPKELGWAIWQDSRRIK